MRAIDAAQQVGAARKKPQKGKIKHNKNKQLTRNGFGRVDVGKPCLGNSANCCSGITSAGQDPLRAVAKRIVFWDNCYLGQSV
jgi:hypothetical protein